MIRTIITNENPLLSMMSNEVGPVALLSPDNQAVIDDLIATLKSTTGIGMAAPQIGELLRIVVLANPLTVLVNPVLTPVGRDMQDSFEGCLSVPGVRGNVQRHKTVRVQALDGFGNPIDTMYTQLRAAVVQHEVDHLDGILYTSRTAQLFPDDTMHAPEPPPQTQTSDRRPLSGSGKTYVVQSPKPVGARQFVSWTFNDRGRVTDLRVTPGAAMVLGVWLSGVRLRSNGFKVGAVASKLLGPNGLYVAAGDQLRIEVQMPAGKKRVIRAEADFDE